MQTTNNSGKGSATKNINGPAPWYSQMFLFAKNFAKHPTNIGWMFPSSRFVVEEILRQIDWTKARVIVEYGPGVGTFTGDILRQMHPDAKLIAFEVNADFCTYLRETIRDPRFVLLQESATEVNSALKRLGLAEADYIISGIPFKTIPEELRGEIVRKTHAALHPEGQFLVYQLSGAVRPYLESVFSRVRHDFEFLSIPPGRLFYCAR
jgi:Phospholipid N-methyltransferase